MKRSLSVKKKHDGPHQVPLKPARDRREWKWANSEKTIENQISHDMSWENRSSRGRLRHKDCRSGRRTEESASLAGASGWLRLFNALINPLLKAMQRVSGFVLWPRDYSGINKGWEGNIDEIPPPLLCCALWLFSNKARDRNDMELQICQRQNNACIHDWAWQTLENTCSDVSKNQSDNSQCMLIIHPHPPVNKSGHAVLMKSIHTLGCSHVLGLQITIFIIN